MIKDQFCLPEGHYFLSHSVGCLPKAVPQQFEQQVFETWRQQGGDAWPHWLQSLSAFHKGIAQLLNAPEQGVCAQSNLSSALTKLLMALPNKDSPKTVLMHAHAFPSMGFVVNALASMGFTLRLIDEGNSPCDMSTWEQALTSDVDICLITHVHSNTGVKSPVTEISEICRQQDIISIVDVAQSVGVVPIDVQQWRVDAVIGSCVKWLCGGPGAGFIWVEDSLLHQLEVVDVGWFSHENPFEFDIRHFSPASNAMKLLGGTPSIAPFVIASSSIHLIQEIGINTIAAHNLTLKQRFAENTLRNTSTEKIEPQMWASQGGTLCIRIKQGHQNISQQLADRQLFSDQRGDVIRLSFHIYNDENDIDVLSDCLASCSVDYTL